jgi:hypothetical protein
MATMRRGIGVLVVTFGVVACGPEEGVDDPPGQIRGALTTAAGPIAHPVVLNGNQMKVFLRNANSRLTRLDYNGSSWLAPVVMDHQIIGEPTAVASGGTVVYAFVRSTDNALWTVSSTGPGGTWTGFERIGGTLTGPPTAVNSNFLDVVFRNSNGQVGIASHSWFPFTIWKFADLPDSAVEGRLAAIAFQGATHIFWLSPTGALRHASRYGDTGRWNAPETLASFDTFTDSPSAVVTGPNEAIVFARGTDGQLKEVKFNGVHWMGAADRFHTGIVGSPSAVAWNGGARINVFVLNPAGRLANAWYDGTWHNIAQLHAAVLSGSPSAIAWGSNPTRLNVFVRGSNGHLYNEWWNGFQWNGLDFLGGGPYP